MNKSEKIEGYELLNLQLKGLLSAQNYTLSNLSNASALLNDLQRRTTYFRSFSNQVFVKPQKNAKHWVKEHLFL